MVSPKSCPVVSIPNRCPREPPPALCRHDLGEGQPSKPGDISPRIVGFWDSALRHVICCSCAPKSTGGLPRTVWVCQQQDKLLFLLLLLATGQGSGDTKNTLPRLMGASWLLVLACRLCHTKGHGCVLQPGRGAGAEMCHRGLYSLPPLEMSCGDALLCQSLGGPAAAPLGSHPSELQRHWPRRRNPLGHLDCAARATTREAAALAFRMRVRTPMVLAPRPPPNVTPPSPQASGHQPVCPKESPGGGVEGPSFRACRKVPANPTWHDRDNPVVAAFSTGSRGALHGHLHRDICKVTPPLKQC